MVQIAAFRFDYDQHTDDILNIAIQSYKLLVRKLKSTKSVVKPIAFFYGIITNKLKELILNQVTKLVKVSRFVMYSKQVKSCTMIGCTEIKLNRIERDRRFYNP
jgi:hypothetical protein